MKLIQDRHTRAIKLEFVRTVKDGGTLEALPDGVCGRMTGVALVYSVADDYGTMFTPGCLAKTRVEGIATGKVKLFADHGAYTDMHVGTVRSVSDVGDSAVMVADLFDTEAGRRMKEYLEAVVASNGETGLSIGFRPIRKEWREVDCDGKKDMMLVYDEIQLREISITPVPAVPGTEVTGIRREPGETDSLLLLRVLRNILKELPEREARAEVDAAYASSAATPSTEAAPPEKEKKDEEIPAESTEAAENAESATETQGDSPVTEEERMEFVRSTFAGV